MPANWTLFAANLKREFGVPNQKTIQQIAKIHADEYINAILQNAAPSLAPNSIVTIINPSLIEAAYQLTFTALFKIREPLIPNYDSDNPSVKEEEARKKIEDIFLGVATAICSSWISEIFTPTIMPGVPGTYVSPFPGYTITFIGDPIELSKNLAKAFFIAQNESKSDIAINKMTVALIEAYSKHMLTLTINFSGLIPQPTGPPILLPIFPIVGVI